MRAGFSPWKELKKMVRAEEHGMVDCHAHLFTEGTLTREQFQNLQGMSLEDKWQEADRMRQDYLRTFPNRIDISIGARLRQGIISCRAYIDIGESIGLEALKIAIDAKKRWQNKGFYLQIAAYPMEGIEGTGMHELLSEACEMPEVEALGCLPSRGRRMQNPFDVSDWKTSYCNMMYFLDVAFAFDKMLDLQLDQKNHPDEMETQLLMGCVQNFRSQGYDRPISATHGISMASWRNKKMLKRTLRLMARLNVSLIVCPGAALNNQQYSNVMVPMHNSIAPWDLAQELGVNVSLGIDNVSDFYMPSCDGDIWKEVKILWDTRRFQGDLSVIADILTKNGRKALGLK